MLDAIFQYLDRGQKGYFSYNDFCMLSEEKRRGLDPIDNHAILSTKKDLEAERKDWVQTYLHDCKIDDLKYARTYVHTYLKSLILQSPNFPG